MNRKYVLSYGGGINTTALMILLVKKKMPLDEAVFADTGAELPETYKNVRIAKRYLRRHGIPLRVVRSNNGTLFETCKRRRVIPSQLWRWSTRDYKITPIYAYYRSLQCHVNQYLGITIDEVDRMKDSTSPIVTNIYPLVDLRLNRTDCVNIIRKGGLPIPPKSGCYFCPFNNVDRWYDIYKNERTLFLRAMRLEEMSKHFPSQRLTNLTLRGLAHEFKRGKPANVELPVGNPCGAECLT
jgi:hypothetical protein